MIRNNIIATVAAWAALSATAAHAQSVTKDAAKPCVSPAEAEALVTVMLPGALRGLHTVCDMKVPADAYLITAGPALASRFEGAAHAAEPVAAKVVGRMAGLHNAMPTTAVAGYLSPLIEAMVVDSKDKLNASACGKASRTLQLLDPLPVQNVTALVELLMELGLSRENDSPFTICEAQA